MQCKFLWLLKTFQVSDDTRNICFIKRVCLCYPVVKEMWVRLAGWSCCPRTGRDLEETEEGPALESTGHTHTDAHGHTQTRYAVLSNRTWRERRTECFTGDGYLPPALRRVGDLVGGHSKVRQDLGDSSSVHTAVGSDVFLAPSVHVHLTHWWAAGGRDAGGQFQGIDEQVCRCDDMHAHVGLTLALQALPHEAPQQGAAVVAERRYLVVVNTELVGHVNTEALRAHLQGATHTHAGAGWWSQRLKGSFKRCLRPVCKAWAPPPTCPPASSSRHTWWWWARGSACGQRTCTLETKVYALKKTCRSTGSVWCTSNRGNGRHRTSLLCSGRRAATTERKMFTSN